MDWRAAYHALNELSEYVSGQGHRDRAYAMRQIRRLHSFMADLQKAAKTDDNKEPPPHADAT